MNLIFQTLLLIFLSLFPNTSFAESNVDIFFKSDNQYKDVVVEEVISTDTIRLETGETIKLIGLHSPEMKRKKESAELDEYHFEVEKPEDPETPVEEQAFDFANNLLKGKHIRLEFDVQKKDAEHRTLAYVFLVEDNTFVNTEIIRRGYAYLQIRPPNSKYDQKLREAYQEARKELHGFHDE